MCLAVRDGGVGMSPDVLARATEPFFTTKPTGRGTGLGLSSAAAFAVRAGGHLTIDSIFGKGTTVVLHLPRMELTRQGDAADGPAAVTAGNGERVLVVEDDDDVRSVTLGRVKALGYHATGAASGAEALARLMTDPSIRVVLSDVVMPGPMSGFDVASWVASNRPSVSVVLASGYPIGERDPAPPTTAMLRKPYDAASLSAALRLAVSQTPEHR